MIGEKEVTRAINKLGKDLPVAVAKGVNRHVEALEQHQLNEMEIRLDRPTPFTRNAFGIWKAKANRPNAVLFIKDIQAKYLRYAIKGGSIPVNLTPTPAQRLNRYGNVPGKRKGLAGIAKAKSKFVAEINGVFGVWQRSGRGGKKVRLLVIVEKEARREKRWDFYGVAERLAKKRLARDIGEAIRRALPR